MLSAPQLVLSAANWCQFYHPSRYPDHRSSPPPFTPAAQFSQDYKEKYKGLHLALRFEYIADRSTPGTAPVLHVYNMSRILRKRAYLSAAFINDAKQPFMPGGRGVPLQAGDVVELGVHPIRSVTGQRTLRLVVEAVGDADGAAGSPPPSYVAAALRDHCAKDKVAAVDSVAETLPPSSPSLKERLSSGPEAAIFGLRSEVVKDPGNTGEEGGGWRAASKKGVNATKVRREGGERQPTASGQLAASGQPAAPSHLAAPSHPAAWLWSRVVQIAVRTC